MESLPQPHQTRPRPRAAPPINLPGFRPRGGFLTDTSESEEEEEEEAEDDDGDLTGGTGSALAASDSALESESDAEGAFWGRPGRVRVAGGPTPPPNGDPSFWPGTRKPGSAVHPVRVSAPLWTAPSSVGGDTLRHADTHGYVHTQPTLTHRHTLYTQHTCTRADRTHAFTHMYANSIVHIKHTPTYTHAHTISCPHSHWYMCTPGHCACIHMLVYTQVLPHVRTQTAAYTLMHTPYPYKHIQVHTPHSHVCACVHTYTHTHSLSSLSQGP